MGDVSVVSFSRPFDVKVCHDYDENVWVAECDALGLVTEANTYEDLTKRVWEIAPELYELNGFGGNPARIHLLFTQEQSWSDRMAL
ncbi:hypothetical protein DOH76_12200 [Salmonella enterica subsp. enterica serovar Oranienburg]|uniref:DUF1902 domain-containing protein n=1 Tax=Salmonella enterica TaxID=28901 RepID=A0A764VXT8_SALER|nr:DUF1902 domain-containing protein [Salmonella enterica]EBG5026309.1 DUF1902 domain-containing protein [Salmonella enterica subsp. enterica serovar Oranienburg]HCA3583968.1 DUF1902 domain-containing protein [Salmonella enterica subsp. enterica serovar Java]EAS1262621.1 DUF1902 domain-containing protein [Salmonella enterica]EBB1604423.1 DUF1902 domain-containing protein [Salmonella enterica]